MRCVYWNSLRFRAKRRDLTLTLHHPYGEGPKKARWRVTTKECLQRVQCKYNCVLKAAEADQSRIVSDACLESRVVQVYGCPERSPARTTQCTHCMQDISLVLLPLLLLLPDNFKAGQICVANLSSIRSPGL